MHNSCQLSTPLTSDLLFCGINKAPSRPSNLLGAPLRCWTRSDGERSGDELRAHSVCFTMGPLWLGVQRLWKTSGPVLRHGIATVLPWRVSRAVARPLVLRCLDSRIRYRLGLEVLTVNPPDDCPNCRRCSSASFDKHMCCTVDKWHPFRTTVGRNLHEG